MTEDVRWRCEECGTVTPEPLLLKAPNPFNPSDVIVGCPRCKSVDQFERLCDEPGCTRNVSCGWPTGDESDSWGGYRMTCGKHWKQ